MSSAPSSSRHNVSETESLIPSTQIESPMTTETEPEKTGEFWELVEKEEPMEKEETVEKEEPVKKGENLMQGWKK